MQALTPTALHFSSIPSSTLGDGTGLAGHSEDFNAVHAESLPASAFPVSGRRRSQCRFYEIRVFGKFNRLLDASPLQITVAFDASRRLHDLTIVFFLIQSQSFPFHLLIHMRRHAEIGIFLIHDVAVHYAAVSGGKRFVLPRSSVPSVYYTIFIIKYNSIPLRHTQESGETP